VSVVKIHQKVSTLHGYTFKTDSLFYKIVHT